MSKVVVIAAMSCVLAATAAWAQERGNLAIPYRFRLPFLEKGEYVVSAFGGHISSEFTAHFSDSPARSLSDNDNSWFDVNGVIAVSPRVLIAAELTVYPRRTTTKFDLSPGSTIEAFSYEDEVDTHVAREFTVVYRPVERFEVFAYYFQDIPHWKRTSSVSNPFNVVGLDNDIKDFRAGVTYFGKF